MNGDLARRVHESLVAEEARYEPAYRAGLDAMRDAMVEVLDDVARRPLRNVLSRYLHERGVAPALEVDALARQAAERMRAEFEGCPGCVERASRK